ncbi:MAG: hypothetical protein ACRC51_07960 [Cetobacterium sp.]
MVLELLEKSFGKKIALEIWEEISDGLLVEAPIGIMYDILDGDSGFWFIEDGYFSLITLDEGLYDSWLENGFKAIIETHYDDKYYVLNVHHWKEVDGTPIRNIEDFNASIERLFEC